MQHGLHSGEKTYGCCGVGTARGCDDHDGIAFVQICDMNFRRAQEDARETSRSCLCSAWAWTGTTLAWTALASAALTVLASATWSARCSRCEWLRRSHCRLRLAVLILLL